MQKLLKISTYLFLSLFFSCEGSLNPNGTGSFIKFFGNALDDEGFTFTQNNQGEIFLVGSSRFTGENREAFVAKSDIKGNRIWEKSFNQPGEEWLGRDIEILGDGNIVILANRFLLGQEDQSSFVLILLNANGDSLGDPVNVGMVSLQNAQNFFLELADNGDLLLIANASSGQGTSGNDMQVLRITLDLNTQPIASTVVFERAYGLNNLDDNTGEIIEIGNGDLLWCGVSNRLDPNSDLRLIRADPFGNPRWDFAIGENDAFTQSGARLIELANEEGIVVIGTSNETGSEEVLLVKLGLNGVPIWQRLININGVNGLQGQALASTEDGGFILAATATTGLQSDLALIKTNAEGTVEWAEVYGSPERSDQARAVSQSPSDGGFIIMGSIGFENNSIIGLIKTDAQGKLF